MGEGIGPHNFLAPQDHAWKAGFCLTAVSGSIKIHCLPGANSRSIKQLIPEADGAGKGPVLKSNRLGAGRLTKEVSGEVQPPCCSLGRGSLLGRKGALSQGEGITGTGRGKHPKGRLWNTWRGGSTRWDLRGAVCGGPSWDEPWKDKKDLSERGVIVIAAMLIYLLFYAN